MFVCLLPDQCCAYRGTLFCVCYGDYVIYSSRNLHTGRGDFTQLSEGSMCKIKCKQYVMFNYTKCKAE